MTSAAVFDAPPSTPRKYLVVVVLMRGASAGLSFAVPYSAITALTEKQTYETESHSDDRDDGSARHRSVRDERVQVGRHGHDLARATAEDQHPTPHRPP